ncbi:cytochrome b5-like Heme/Steroid binding domain containing protein, putative [Eimeria tenella]|uniref:Cytochrome b5-like Heme/Steroid binding domain containing protein, putative n=1 Tax=Eimeria tenella TaxID=5802 RepID=U6L1Q4_EIMTE|nr:cytochrome b5-like Heme/Steroid binding domain containing protein, putative [Eimeria tenella]CDJ44337.1 cytochrome b5-like Heme/Steroid binding domain containing protein, putative [Eimeria tenella]|eukprot:XP_013235086.1 cytochrome b5-like Heme/Steroid binding domain containing protein, putative [Eimeria tenella]
MEKAPCEQGAAAAAAAAAAADVDVDTTGLPQMTLEALKSCDGEKSEKLFVAVKGLVFDVSVNGKTFYGKNGSYHIFAGKDATVALARMSFDEKLLNSPPSTWESLTESEKESLQSWLQRFKSKYSLVAVVDFEEKKDN